MPTLTRRQILEVLSLALPLSSLGCRRRELLPEERVCAHVFPETLALPEVVLREFGPAPTRDAAAITFSTGLPELFVCTSPVPFLQLFPYFWPIEPDELRRARESVRVLFRVDGIASAVDAEDAERWLAGRILPAGAVGVFTYNDFTRFFARRLLLALRAAGASEVVVFKDPSVPPYLCDEPARQRRFRRPPP